MASPNVHEFNDLNFEAEVLKSDQTVLVDFTASWCGPCKMLSPIVDQVADELKGQLKVGKLDIDNAPLTAAKYAVQSVPTLMLFKNGERTRVQLGAIPKGRLLDFVNAE
ncbi:MAG: thioredoxin [Polyangiaceae bacterium]|nr:thioredoxin [Polyangiaceae bacterium]MCW5789019.1 thioredoxin [Polyangiaceae bacterium]